MTRQTRLGVSLSAALPTLITALVVCTVLAIGGVVSWTVEPAIVLAVAVQSLVTFVRLGRLTNPARAGEDGALDLSACRPPASRLWWR